MLAKLGGDGRRRTPSRTWRVHNRFLPGFEEHECIAPLHFCAVRHSGAVRSAACPRSGHAGRLLPLVQGYESLRTVQGNRRAGAQAMPPVPGGAGFRGCALNRLCRVCLGFHY